MKQSGKKIGLVFLLTLLCCFSCALPALAATDRYTSMVFDITLQPDGDVQIEQTSQAYFPSNYSTAYFELERKGFSAISDVWVKVNGISAQRLNLPDLATRPGYFYYSDEGDPYAALDAHPELKGRYTVQTVPKEYKSGNPYFEWYIEKQKVDFNFQVGYTAKDVIQVYADTAEFSWMPVSSKNSFPLENVLVRVHIPEGSGIAKDDILAWGHGPLSGTVYIASPTLVTFKVDNLAAGDYLDLRLAMPTQLFAQAPQQSGNRLPTILAQEEDLAKEANIERTKARLQLIAPAACLLVLLLLGAFTRRYVKKMNRPYTPQQKPEYFRDLPSDAYPALVNQLYYYPKGERAEYKSQRLTATLLDLAARGVIAIEQTEEKGFLGKKRHTVIARLKETGAANGYETKLMQILFEFVQPENNRINLKELSAYGSKHAETISHAFEELDFMAEADLEKYGYMDYAPLSPWKPFFKVFLGVFAVSALLYFVWSFLGIFLLIAGLILLPLFAAGLKKERLSQKRPMKKPFGALSASF